MQRFLNFLLYFCKRMDSLFLFQFACFIFMLVNASFLALSHLHVRWENKRYERSRWMIVIALIGLAIQYVIQMGYGFRAMHDHLGAVINILLYTPCFSLTSIGIHSLARSSRYAGCHLFHHLIIYSRSCRIVCPAVLQSYVYCPWQQLYPYRRTLG